MISKSFSGSLEQFFLTVGQNNFGNKIPFQLYNWFEFDTYSCWRPKSGVFLMRFLNLVHCDMHSRSYNFSILKLLIFFFLISGSSLLLKMEPSCDDHWSFFVVEKKHLTYMWFLFLVIYTTTFLMINPKKNEKKYVKKKYKNFSIWRPRFRKKRIQNKKSHP